MSDKNIDIKVGTKNEFSPASKKISSDVDGLAKKLKSSQKELHGLNQLSGKMDKFTGLGKKLQRNADEMRKAQAEVQRLSKAYSQAENPTKKMALELDRARDKVKRLALAQKQNRRTLGNLRSELKGAGVDTSRMADSQRELARMTERASDAVAKQTKLTDKLRSAEDRFKKGEARAARIGAVGAGITVAAAQGRRAIGAPVMRGVGFEEAMVDVHKFVDDADSGLSRKILNAGKNSTLGAAGVAELVAAGGQIGLNQKDSLGFADQAQRFAVAWGMSVNDTGENLKTIKSGMNVSIPELGILGDAINKIADSTSTDANSLTQILARSGSIARHAGLSNAQATALAGAIDAASPSAEVSATGMKNMLNALTSGRHMPKKQGKILRGLGFEPQSIAEGMQSDAVGTIRSVLGSISELDPADRSGTIEALFGRESQAAVASLVGNMEEYDRMMGVVADRTNYVGSAQAEYERTLKTSGAQLKLLSSRFDVLQIKWGTVMLPALNGLISAGEKTIGWVEDLSERFPTATKVALGLGAGIVGLATVIGPVIMGIGALTYSLAGLRLAANRAAVSSAAAGLGGPGGAAASRKGGRLGKVAGMMGGKTNLALTAAIGAYSIGSTAMDDSLSGSEKGRSISRDVGSIGGGGLGMWGGAAAGAAIGSVVPIVGTAAGGVVGGLIGAFGGSMAGDWLGGKAGDAIFSEEVKAAAAAPLPPLRSAGTVNAPVNISVQAAPGMDENALARKVASQVAREMERLSRLSRSNGLYDTEPG